MIRIRIEAAGYVLKNSGSGYAIGKVLPKKLKDGQTERMIHPVYPSSLRSALQTFAECVLRDSKTPEERDLVRLIFGALALFGNAAPGPTLSDVRFVAGISKRRLARKTGVSRTTIREIELHDREPLLSTFVKLLEGCGVAKW